MATYLSRARYSGEALRGMIADPHDRTPVSKALFESVGMSLSGCWFSPSTAEFVCIAEGDGVQIATIDMVAMASGMFTWIETIELIGMDAMHVAMSRAAGASASYRSTVPPR